MGVYRTVSNDNVVPFTTHMDEFSRERDLAAAVAVAAADLQRAMDAAIEAGLLVEPTFETAEFRSTSVTTATESYCINLQILRKLL